MPPSRYAIVSFSPPLFFHLSIQALHQSLPSFSPIVPVELLPYLAIILLASTFALAFYFSTYVLFDFGHKPHQ